ncbi:MAG: hypothetical protein V3S97_06280 [Candidatus Bathyarchaeia archaeon]
MHTISLLLNDLRFKSSFDDLALVQLAPFTYATNRTLKWNDTSKASLDNHTSISSEVVFCTAPVTSIFDEAEKVFDRQTVLGIHGASINLYCPSRLS